MSKKILLFIPCAYNLAETTRMVQIAKGVMEYASDYFEVDFN